MSSPALPGRRSRSSSGASVWMGPVRCLPLRHSVGISPYSICLIWVFSYLFGTIYMFSWDVKVDWGLMPNPDHFVRYCTTRRGGRGQGGGGGGRAKRRICSLSAQTSPFAVRFSFSLSLSLFRCLSLSRSSSFSLGRGGRREGRNFDSLPDEVASCLDEEAPPRPK